MLPDTVCVYFVYSFKKNNITVPKLNNIKPAEIALNIMTQTYEIHKPLSEPTLNLGL